MPRNSFLFDNAIHLLPYTGAGSGIVRAMGEDVDVTFSNNERLSEFLITIPREEEMVNIVRESHKVSDIDSGLRHSGADLDTNSKRVPLTKKQKDIVNFCSVPRTSREILDRLGMSNQTKNRERYITPLVIAGYLQMTNPENPKTRNQRYMKVNLAKGV